MSVTYSWNLLESGVSYEFSILHSYFRCFSFQNDHQALKQQTWNKTRPILQSYTTNRQPTTCGCLPEKWGWAFLTFTRNHGRAVLLWKYSVVCGIW